MWSWETTYEVALFQIPRTIPTRRDGIQEWVGGSQIKKAIEFSPTGRLLPVPEKLPYRHRKEDDKGLTLDITRVCSNSANRGIHHASFEDAQLWSYGPRRSCRHDPIVLHCPPDLDGRGISLGTGHWRNFVSSTVSRWFP